ncbi:MULTISPECIES: (deoxy)nucleoside triphosphate pyrophosphohydrolase [Mumia]|uniref:(deoxy)nucleoside triphosphate pyrophosphohydrolase n=1 Tax=Mumia TaxID=1546255 RepID=UPI001FBB3471|nr:(deoxy)nucleoside triphosphate pyrophosphohydrolase [Mumia sp. ZJ1417]
MDPRSTEPAPVPAVVVGVALLRGGRVLAARRTSPPALAGGWEFPGGKVEPGESEAKAVRREVAEELRCEAAVVQRLDGEVPLAAGMVLRVYVGEVVSGDPVPTEHDRLRWLGPDELDDVPWLDADRPFLPEVAALLRRTHSEGAEAHFDEGDDADQVVAALRADGYEAVVRREGFAGEDDSEDRAWLVRVEGTAAADALAALVADVELAWMIDHAAPAPVPPPPLPTGPKRLKRKD